MDADLLREYLAAVRERLDAIEFDRRMSGVTGVDMRHLSLSIACMHARVTLNTQRSALTELDLQDSLDRLQSFLPFDEFARA